MKVTLFALYRKGGPNLDLLLFKDVSIRYYYYGMPIRQTMLPYNYKYK
jgi:hypothetical protein